MKIAIPTINNRVDDHFGHCQEYTIFTLNKDNKIEKQESLPSPQGCGCKSNIAAILQEKGVEILLAGNMGNGALNVLNNHNIRVIRGCYGDVNLLLEKFINKGLKDSGEGCNSHDSNHTCNH